jgi:chemotaxis protein MotA
MDLASVLGTLLGLFAIFGGALIEGLRLGDVMAGTAALIVFGGTAAATFLSFPMADIRRALGGLPVIYGKSDVDLRPLIAEIVEVAGVVRKEGLLAVEGQRESIQDPLFKRSVKYVIDGFDANTVRDILENEITVAAEQHDATARVWEGAGGYAPTAGILGAVLGLIHVMQSLDNPAKIGGGIAVAFVATVYGLSLSNLVLLPWGAKLRRKFAQKLLALEVVKVGVVGLQEGLSPHFIQEKLEVFVDEKLRGVPLPEDA